MNIQFGIWAGIVGLVIFSAGTVVGAVLMRAKQDQTRDRLERLVKQQGKFICSVLGVENGDVKGERRLKPEAWLPQSSPARRGS